MACQERIRGAVGECSLAEAENNMSKLRKECGKGDKDSVSLPRDTALFLIRDSVERRRRLIHGRLHGPKGLHCAMGCFWADNPNAAINENLVDEIATVNDSLGPNVTTRERWFHVRKWLRWKLRVMSTAKAKA